MERWLRIGTFMALVVLAGCGATPGPSNGGPTAAPTATVESAATPATEDPVPPTAAPTDNGGSTATSVSLPQFPIGGSDDTEDGLHCVSVSYLGRDPIPAGIRITATGPLLDKQGRKYFHAEGSSCGGRTACAGFGWTEDSRNDTCSVLLRETGATKDEDDTSSDPRLRLTGKVACPAGRADDCATLRTNLATDDQSIGISPPLTPAGGTASAAPSSTPPG